ncbi:unnamed protein product [Lathyrus sativus]|nr:unnamed protein product [Lathyrus sativus]
MGSSSKKSKIMQKIDTDSDEYDDVMSDEEVNNDSEMEEEEEVEEDEDDGTDGEEEDEDEGEDEGEDDGTDEEEEDGTVKKSEWNHDEMEELEKQYRDLHHQEQQLNILKNLKHHKDEDLLKGQAAKTQKALWYKILELRFLLQKPFSSSNRLPEESVKASFCESDETVRVAYADLITSSKETLNSMLELQEALIAKNPSVTQAINGSEKSSKDLEVSYDMDDNLDQEWSQVSRMHNSIASFRDKSINKWQRKTQVTSGAAAIKGKHAFNQDISNQVAGYMRDPSRMVKQMQLSRSAVNVFGSVSKISQSSDEAVRHADGDPELLDDSEFYQQLLKEFFETVDPTSSEKAFYALKRMQTKKRKIVDRRASKSRKIRYNVHEKIVNFMAPQPANIPPMAPMLFENLFGLKTQRSSAAAS